MLKRVLSVVICVCLAVSCFSVLGITASADDTESIRDKSFILDVSEIDDPNDPCSWYALCWDGYSLDRNDEYWVEGQPEGEGKVRFDNVSTYADFYQKPLNSGEGFDDVLYNTGDILVEATSEYDVLRLIRTEDDIDYKWEFFSPGGAVDDDEFYYDTIPGTNLVYYDLKGWGNLYCYAWNDNGEENATWPGVRMVGPVENGFGEQMYGINMSRKYTHIIFNDGFTNGDDNRTVDIDYDGEYVGFAYYSDDVLWGWTSSGQYKEFPDDDSGDIRGGSDALTARICLNGEEVSKTVISDKTFKVTYNLKHNTPIVDAQATLTYDSSKLILDNWDFPVVEYSVIDNLSASDKTAAFNFTSSKRPFDFSQGAELVTAYFTVKDGAEGTANVNLDEIGRAHV